MRPLDGKEVSAALKNSVKLNIEKKIKEFGEGCPVPRLLCIQVGDNPASKIYVRNKTTDCAEVGIECVNMNIPEDGNDTDYVVQVIKEANNDPNIHAILVQLPLPNGFDEEKILQSISPLKDADCFTYENIGRFYNAKYEPAYKDILPCTPHGIKSLMEWYGISPYGKDCVVIGKSNIVGKPMAKLLTIMGGTVTLCHSKTRHLHDFTKRADIIVSATGQRGLVDGNMVKDGVILIDVGMNRDENGKLCGDMTESAYAKSDWHTPVPGGVGPMTRAALMWNIFLLWEKSLNK